MPSDEERFRFLEEFKLTTAWDDDLKVGRSSSVPRASESTY